MHPPWENTQFWKGFRCVGWLLGCLNECWVLTWLHNSMHKIICMVIHQLDKSHFGSACMWIRPWLFLDHNTIIICTCHIVWCSNIYYPLMVKSGGMHTKISPKTSLRVTCKGRALRSNNFFRFRCIIVVLVVRVVPDLNIGWLNWCCMWNT